MKKYYAGIGSRETPSSVQPIITSIAEFLYEEGYTLRSGGAPGADKMFEQAVPDKTRRDIYVPWYCFNSSTSPLCRVSQEAIDFSLAFHPNPYNMKLSVQKLMGRNAYQVLGLDLKTKSDFIVCWTKDAADGDTVPLANSGGTGQAMRIALAYGIKIFNIAQNKDFEKWYMENNFDLM